MSTMRGEMNPIENMVGELNPVEHMEGDIIPRGLDGISPKVEVTQINGGYHVKITDKTGIQEFDLMNGTDARVEALVHPIEGGYTITITDDNGTMEFDLMHGKDGADGRTPNVWLAPDLSSIDGIKDYIPVGHLVGTADPNLETIVPGDMIICGKDGGILYVEHTLSSVSGDLVVAWAGMNGPDNWQDGAAVKIAGAPGKDGVSPNLSIGTVTTLKPGSDATASITGQSPNLRLNLGIPRGGNSESDGDGGDTAFVGDGNTTVAEYYEAFSTGKVCFMKRGGAGGAKRTWVLDYCTQTYAYFYHIHADNGWVEYGRLTSDGTWASEMVESDDVDLTGYATEEWVQKGYQPKGDYALRSEIPTIDNEVLVVTIENDMSSHSPAEITSHLVHGGSVYCLDGGHIYHPLVVTTSSCVFVRTSVVSGVVSQTRLSFGNSMIVTLVEHASQDIIYSFLTEEQKALARTNIGVDLTGYAKKEDIPTKAEDIGALPSTYTPPDQTAAQVGADPAGTAESKVSAHNTNTGAHNDIRLLITGLTARLDALANSDDDTLDQMAEVVAYIKANRDLIDQITTGKVSVSDIVNNLTTNVTNKPLSAAQGVALKALIDAITVPTKLSQLSDDSTHRVVTDTEKATWNAKSNFSGKYADLSGKPTIPTVPTKVSAFTNDAGYITGYTETDPTVPSWAKAASKPSYNKSEVGLGNVDNVKQYSASNPPPYPVTSVNGKTGVVTLSASDVNARPGNWIPSGAEITQALGYTPLSSDKTITITGKDTDGNDHVFIVVGWGGGADEPN